MSMVFSHITVLDLKLPDLAADSSQPNDQPENQMLELVILPDRFVVNYPAGAPLKTVPQKEGEYDYTLLSDVLQEVKRLLKDRGIEKRDIFILSQPDTDYQTLVSVMDTARSFKAVVVASVVNAELFPDISLGDAPVNTPAAGGAP
jgi:biopolymer transport protein ExbD